MGSGGGAALAGRRWWSREAGAALAGALAGAESRKPRSSEAGRGMAESPAAEEAAPAAVLAAAAAGSGGNSAGPGGGAGSPGVFIPAELWAAAGFGAATPGTGVAPGSGGAPIAAAAAAAGAALLTHSAFWDPTVSGDWDSERPSPACLLRIKR